MLARRWRRLGITLALAMAVVVAIVLLDAPGGIPTASPREEGKAGVAVAPGMGGRAPELVGIAGWINSPPLTLAQLRGKVVLIDFWTYTCVNCIRTFPYLRAWHENYAAAGLVIIGVHTPEFSFEKERENVVAAAQRYQLTYAIAQDNDYATWRAYENRFWPHKFLIDKEGVIRYHHIGEGRYEETEEWIRTLLKEITPTLPQGLVVKDPTEAALVNLERMTPELYAGYNWGWIDNARGQERVEGAFFHDPGEYLPSMIYLQGQWTIGPELVYHVRQTEHYFDDYVFLRYTARSANMVIHRSGGQPFPVWVTVDGQYLNESNKGADILFDEKGQSYIWVDSSRMYNLVSAPEFGSHDLLVEIQSPNFAFSAFTFGP